MFSTLLEKNIVFCAGYEKDIFVSFAIRFQTQTDFSEIFG